MPNLQYESALGLFVPQMGRLIEFFGCLDTRCSLKIELCDKLEPLKKHPVSGWFLRVLIN